MPSWSWSHPGDLLSSGEVLVQKGEIVLVPCAQYNRIDFRGGAILEMHVFVPGVIFCKSGTVVKLSGQ